MKLKRILTAATAMLLIMGQCVAAYADNTVITLDKSATKFTTIDQDLDFQDMEPGEERTATLTMTNDSDGEMDFYICGEITYNIADQSEDKANNNAIYELQLSKSGQADPFFDGMIGSKENKELTKSNTGLEYLKDDTLLATLGKGESTSVTIQLKLDGDSLENAYMNKAGQIRLNIRTSQSAGLSGNNNGNSLLSFLTVQTGDTTRIVLYVLIAIAAVAVLAGVLIAGRRKKNRTEQEK